MANLFPIPRYQPQDGNGAVYPGALLYSYAAGTTTPLATYTTSTLAVANANPVVADSNGRFSAVWMASSDYKFVLKTSAGVTVWTEDNISGTFDVTGNDYKPSQQSTADMTVLVAAGSFWDAPTGAIVSNAAQTSALITAPVTNPRIDTVHMNRRTGVIGVTTGSEAASPTAPTLAAGLLPVANVTLATTTTEITDSLITDVRELEQLGLGTAAAVDTGVSSGQVPVMDATGYPAADGSQLTNMIPPASKAPPTMANNATDPAKDIDFAAGYCRAENTAVLITNTALTKRLDASWVAGTNQGGLSSSLHPLSAAAQTVYCFAVLIGGAADFLFDTSSSCANGIADHLVTAYRRVGSILTNATPDIVPFWQDGDRFILDVPVVDANTTPSLAGAAVTLSVPPNTNAIFTGALDLGGTPGKGILFTETRQTNTAPSASLYDLYVDAISTAAVAAEFVRRVDASSQIRQRATSATSITYRIKTTGWIDSRGRNA